MLSYGYLNYELYFHKEKAIKKWILLVTYSGLFLLSVLFFLIVKCKGPGYTKTKTVDDFYKILYQGII